MPQVGNSTDSAVSYTVGDPGDPTDLNKQCFRHDSRLNSASPKTPKLVEFKSGTIKLASTTVTSPNVVVLLHKESGAYRASVLNEHPGLTLAFSDEEFQVALSALSKLLSSSGRSINFTVQNQQ
jgi:hypothetical protein